MEESNKLWVISLADECSALEPLVEQPEFKRHPPRPVTPIKRTIPKPPIRRIKNPSGRLHFATKMALSYLLGPFALLLWSVGRKNSIWSLISLFSGIGSVTIAWKWRSILALGSGESLLVPLMVLAGVFSLLAFTSWAKALQLAFASRTRSHTSWPTWMRSSWAVTGLGFLAPGLGLYLAGSYRRAVVVAWSIWPVFLAAVVLTHSMWTWQWLQNSLHSGGSEEMFEKMMMVAAGVLVLGFGGWLIQALAGLHRVTMLSRAASGGVNGDRYAMALLVAVMALAVLFPSGDMASFVNEAGVCLHQEGFQLIPLQLARSAHALEPGEITYSLQVAALHRERGEMAEADTIQQNLDQNLQVYLGMMGQQASEVEPEPAALKISPKVLSQNSEPAPDPKVESWAWPLIFGPQLGFPQSPQIL